MTSMMSLQQQAAAATRSQDSVDYASYLQQHQQQRRRSFHVHEANEHNASFSSTKGLLNGPGQNNCFLNSAVQVTVFSFLPSVARGRVCTAENRNCYTFPLVCLARGLATLSHSVNTVPYHFIRLFFCFTFFKLPYVSILQMKARKHYFHFSFYIHVLFTIYK